MSRLKEKKNAGAGKSNLTVSTAKFLNPEFLAETKVSAWRPTVLATRWRFRRAYTRATFLFVSSFQMGLRTISENPSAEPMILSPGAQPFHNPGLFPEILLSAQNVFNPLGRNVYIHSRRLSLSRGDPWHNLLNNLLLRKAVRTMSSCRTRMCWSSETN